MAVGDSALIGSASYIALGRETTYGTYATGTAGLSFLSASMKVMKEVKILEEVQMKRTHSNSIQLGKSLEGEIEFYFSPKNLACNYLLQNAFGGGPVTTATATGETAGGLAFTHVIDIANFDQTYSSLSMNMRKGDSAAAKLFEYSGLRVNELSMVAEIDEPLMCNVSLIGKDMTLSSNDVSAKLDTSTAQQLPLSFVNGRFSILATSTVASLTTTGFWHVQNIEFSVANNLHSDAGARRIGSDVLQVLPPGIANLSLKATIRFDTTTALAANLAGTRLVGEFEFLSDTLTGSAIKEGVKLVFPYLLVQDAGDPEVSGPNEILTSEVTFAVLRDGSSAGGYAVKAHVTNLTGSYA